MEPKFTTTSVYTYDEFKKYNFQLIGKKNLILSSLIALILALCALVLQSPTMLAYAVIIPLLLYILYKVQVKRFYNANKSAHNNISTFEFYDDCFIQKDKRGDSKLEYNKLFRFIFTKENVYLMLSKNHGFMLSKSNFPEGLEVFLKSVAPKKKKKK